MRIFGDFLCEQKVTPAAGSGALVPRREKNRSTGGLLVTFEELRDKAHSLPKDAGALGVP